jgi:hypothetical protein
MILLQETDEMATFFVYENSWGKENQWYTMIHFADCYHCENGRGHNVRDLPDDVINWMRLRQATLPKISDRWLGPFQTYQQALDAAMLTGKEVRQCRVCAPHS